MTYTFVVLDDPRPHVRRITLNRPAKRNALSNTLRREIFDALSNAEADPDVHVSIIRGAGPCFSAGYDLATSQEDALPYPTAGGQGQWPRHLVEGYFRMWDLAKPVIAQVHGYCLAGGAELASACDLIYVAEDAQIGYPAVRSISPPDTQIFPWVLGLRQAMEMMLTGDPIDGLTAVAHGFANRAYPAAMLDDRVLDHAERIACIPQDVQQLNKRAVHRQMEAMGIRNGLRAGTELQALSMSTQTARNFGRNLMEQGVTKALSNRDGAFGDYRTSSPQKPVTS